MNKKHGNTGKRNAAINDENSESCIYARCLTSDKSKWVKAAQGDGLKLSKWIVKNLNKACKTQSKIL